MTVDADQRFMALALYAPGLGYYALSPEMQDERVDATTRGFLGLTVACAQCHNHKFDPIPQTDYYSLQGVFSSSELSEAPLAPKDVVEKWDAQKKALDKLQANGVVLPPHFFGSGETPVAAVTTFGGFR